MPIASESRKRSTYATRSCSDVNKRAKAAVASPIAEKSSIIASNSSKIELHRASRLLKSDFDKAFEVLMQMESSAKLVQAESSAKSADSEDEDDFGPVVVRSNVSQGEVLRFRSKHEKLGFRIRFRPDKEYGPDKDADQIIGKVVAKELPRAAHEVSAGFVNKAFDRGISEKYHVWTLNFQSSPTCTIPGYGIKEPDGSWKAEGLAIGSTVLDCGEGPFPSGVLEVAYTNESLPRLKTELAEWVSPTTSVMVAIGIKIFKPRQGGARRIVALVYRRGFPNPEQEVEVGTTLPTAAGLQLVIQVADLYHGVALPPGYTPGDTLTVDLAALQAKILSEVF